LKASVYIETSVISYLVSYPSRDLVVAGHQQITHEWWHRRRQQFECFISEAVRKEAEAGDPTEAQKRVDAIRDVAVLEMPEAARELARCFLDQGALPPKAAADALHIAIATTTGMDFLVTWNCTHIANAQVEKKLADLCRVSGWDLPIICTPEQLWETAS
jgi:hypothetical protein